MLLIKKMIKKNECPLNKCNVNVDVTLTLNNDLKSEGMTYPYVSGNLYLYAFLIKAALDQTWKSNGNGKKDS